MDICRSVTNRSIILKSTQIFIVAAVVLMALLISLICVGTTVRYGMEAEDLNILEVTYEKLDLPREQQFWFDRGITELEKSLRVSKRNEAKTDNVIIFLVNGADVDMLVRPRLRDRYRMWETFPHMTVLKNKCSKSVYCDPFSIGTSLFGGVEAKQRNCSETLNESLNIHSIIQQAQTLGLRTGIVTSQGVTEPIMASLYAHSASINFNCDADISSEREKRCKDFATQLIEGKTGQQLNVIMAGGRKTLSKTGQSPVDACNSLNVRNLLMDCQTEKQSSSAKFKLITKAEDLDKVNGFKIDHLFGLFNSDKSISQMDANITDMVRVSLDTLKRKKSKYMLIVETIIDAEKYNSLDSFDQMIRETMTHRGYKRENTLLLVAFINHCNSSKCKSSRVQDALVYATGPLSFLFHSVHSETHLARVIAFGLERSKSKRS